MDKSPLPNAKARPLAGLMKLTADDRAEWAPGELAAILRHQLAAPLEYDLRTIAPGGAATIGQMTASISIGPRPRSFGDLIAHPHPPMDLITLMKDFARGARDDGSIPVEVGTMIYYAAIMLALSRHQARITKLDDAAIVGGVNWAIAQPWIEPGLKTFFAEGLRKM